MTPPPEPPRFWCHECAIAVETRVDEPSEEVCCVQCGGNFVEEIEEDDPPQDFRVEQVEDTQTQTQPPAVSAGDATRAEIRNEFGGTRPLPRPTARAARFGGVDEGQEGPPPLPDLFQLLSGATGQSTRFMSNSGNPVEFYVSEAGEGGDPTGILDALGGMFPAMTGNPGDYAFGNMANVINQLMQNDPNRHGAPPAAKEVVEKLPKVKITQSEVDVLRPGSSVLKPGVRERQRELETVITKYELLLAIGRTKNPDFASLDLPQLVFRLADLDGGDEEASIADSAETMQTTLQDMLEKTRRLYQLPEIAKSNLAVQGEVQVLLEIGELLTFCGNLANAMAVYAEAIRLCYNIEDETTEAILVLM
uniref:RING-type E3 ubiquitin transferase n=1 Tax=Phytophthora ramorum TaxID=164328 RepID=H3HEA0_PHYRM